MSLTTSKIAGRWLLVIGGLISGASWLPAPAMANGARSPKPATLVAVLQDNGEAGARRSAEAEASGRRSAEAEAGPRRSAEAEGQRPSPEASREQRNSAEGEVRRALEGFRPQTQREASLYRMILQLQRELAQLRQLQTDSPARERTRTRDSDALGRTRPRDGEQPPARDPAQERLEKIYQAYDKDRNGQVSFAEFLAMREGANDPRVRAQAQESFKQADRNGDGHLSFEEFLAASRRRNEGDSPREGDRPSTDGDRPRQGAGDRPGPRDGQAGVRDRQ